MKRILVISWIILLGISLGFAHDHTYRVVFDLTSNVDLDQKAVVRWVKEIAAAYPNAALEVVMYGKGIELVMPEKSAFITDVQNAVKHPNVSFKVCAAALKNNQVDRGQIIKEAKIVPDAIYEIVSKQYQGWGYIKVSH
jgi:intracellular sulfur oxidation DsrE/DsrF family protein